VREFRLAACGEDNLNIDLAFHVPPSLEILRYSRSLPFLHHFDDWIKHSSDHPQLNSFQLTVDPEIRVKGPLQEFSPEAFDAEFEEMRRALYGPRILKANRPFVDLLT
jgi:hypothetical protein